MAPLKKEAWFMTEAQYRDWKSWNVQEEMARELYVSEESE